MTAVVDIQGFDVAEAGTVLFEKMSHRHDALTVARLIGILLQYDLNQKIFFEFQHDERLISIAEHVSILECEEYGETDEPALAFLLNDAEMTR